MLDRGFTIFRVRGIPVKLHITLLIILPYAAWIWANEFETFAHKLDVSESAMSLPALVWGTLLAVGLFVSVLVHELAHSFVALRHGVPVRSITLMMLGGVSSMEHDDHDHEAWMAFAGPLASFALAVGSYGVHQLVPLPEDAQIALLMFAFMNALLGAFNLLPAFPMDGGRVLRGLLSGPLGHAKATKIATSMGKVAAVLLAVLGVAIGNFFLPLIAVFVYLGASAEEKRVGAKEGLRGVPIINFMTDRLGEARLDETASTVAARLLRDNLVGARVMMAAEVPASPQSVGVVTALDLAHRSAYTTEPTTVGAAMRADLPRVYARADAASVIDALAGSNASAVVVLDEHERVIGLVTPADAERALSLSLEQQSRKRRT